MILNIMMHKNKKIDCFTQPIFTDLDPEKFAIQEARSLKIAKNLEDIVPYKNLTLFFLGTFDDESGAIVLEDDGPRLLMDCSKIVKDRLKEEGVEHVESVPINS